MNAHRLVVAMAFAAGLATAPPLTAQKPVARVQGVIKDTEGRPLEGASVEILGKKLTVQSNNQGAFRLDSIPAGRYWLAVRRIGYVPIQLTMTLDPDSTRDLPIEMERMPTRLSDVTVTGDAMSKYKYSDFYWRSRSAFGKFLTRDDLAKTRAFDLIDVVQRYLPGRSRFALEQRAWFDPSPFGGSRRFDQPFGMQFRSASSFGGPSASDCTPGISIDGAIPWPGASLLDYGLDDVEAIEVYRNDRWLPLQFGTSPVANRCGLVVIWLR
ncbi:MAG: carboxypeptidase-like regulatory domain-containing protein [Gemmatimonadota bacterium]